MSHNILQYMHIMLNFITFSKTYTKPPFRKRWITLQVKINLIIGTPGFFSLIFLTETIERSVSTETKRLLQLS